MSLAKKIIFPAARRVVSKLISHEIVSVQPMTLPEGFTFFMNYSYGSMCKHCQKSMKVDSQNTWLLSCEGGCGNFIIFR